MNIEIKGGAGSGGNALDVPFAWTWISQAGERHVTTYERHARDVADADGCVVHAITPQILAARQPVGEPVNIEVTEAAVEAAYSTIVQAGIRWSARDAIEAALPYLKVQPAPPAPAAARQAVGEPVAVVSQETYNDNGTSDIIKPALPIGTPLYTVPPAPAAVPVDQFRDADHLAEWLGSLVAACGQEEWDAAQAAMNGVRAFQNHPDAVERLRAAIEGECDGLAISGQQASAILAHVILPEPDGFFATNPQPAAAKEQPNG